MASSTPTKTLELNPEHQELLLRRRLKPMQAVDALYAEGDGELAEAIIACLSEQVFGGDLPKPAGRLKCWLAGRVFRLLKRTTRTEAVTNSDGEKVTRYRNPLFEKSGHPYAQALLEPSGAEFVEGGDPMNAPYMMIPPEIRRNAGLWDKLLLGSVQGTDVQLRFMWEARNTHAAARERLATGKPVRIKAAAAGTGLCPILVYDRLVREGHDPESITVIMTDRCESNVSKTRRLLGKLSTTKGNLADATEHVGINARFMDLLHATPSQGQPGGHDGYHVVTLVGILEYFRGFTSSTTEEHLGEPVEGDASEAAELLGKMAEMTAESGVLIANTYRACMGSRILEIFGKRFRFRNRKDLEALAATAGFVPIGTSGPGNVYDIEVFEKQG